MVVCIHLDRAVFPVPVDFWQEAFRRRSHAYSGIPCVIGTGMGALMRVISVERLAPEEGKAPVAPIRPNVTTTKLAFGHP